MFAVRTPIVASVLALALPVIGCSRLSAQTTVTPEAAAAQPVRPSLPETTARAVRAVRAPVIDGHDDDAVWASALPMTEFRQFDPAENTPPTFRTEARIAFDDRYLYVHVRAFDPHPDSIVSLLSRRDVKTSSDQITIIIDAFHDRRTGVQLAVNPAGVKRDFSVYSDATADATWDGVWDVATSTDSAGWQAEFRVPFTQLRFSTGDSLSIGFGVWRDIARLNQRDAWPVYRASARTLMSQMGTVTGIEHIKPVRRLELQPYAVVKSAPDPFRALGVNKSQVSGGLDVKAGLTPNVTVDATVLPDFGQVEADPAVLNLSAFEIRFDERRTFFQEGAGLYKCGGPCEGFFYTRRIGRTPQLRSRSTDAAFTNILGAAKITGRFDNGVAFGVVNAVTEQVQGTNNTTIEPRTNYFVARGLRELRGGRTQFGFQLTDVRRDLDAFTSPLLRRSATGGALQGYTRFAHDKWELMGYTGFGQVAGSANAIALTQTSSVHYFQRPDHEATYDPTRTTLAGHAFGLSLKQVGGRIRYENFLRWASSGLELNDLGFVMLVNDAQIRQSLDFRQLQPSRLFRSSFSTMSLESHWTTGGLLAAQTLSVHTSASLKNNWGGAITSSLSDAGGTHCVSCARGGPALRQSMKQNIRFDIVGDPRPLIVPRAAFRVGTSDEGRSWYRGGDAGVDVRVASRFSISAAAALDHVINDQQWVANFGAPLSDTTHYTFARLQQNILSVTSRINWTATPTLSVQVYAQPFVSSGAFDNWRELASPRNAQYDARFRPYGNGAIPRGFNSKQFNSNVVVRWEYRPASTLFVVWQQGRTQQDRNLGMFGAGRDLNDLFGTKSANTVLVKMSYWFNP
ncbi:MAG: DUF5916 domain-containing protein [Gemmatimonadaceae bacterium]